MLNLFIIVIFFLGILNIMVVNHHKRRLTNEQKVKYYNLQFSPLFKYYYSLFFIFIVLLLFVPSSKSISIYTFIALIVVAFLIRLKQTLALSQMNIITKKYAIYRIIYISFLSLLTIFILVYAFHPQFLNYTIENITKYTNLSNKTLSMNYWKCYDTITCTNGNCKGQDGQGSLTIKPYLPNKALNTIPDGTYHFFTVSMSKTGPWRMPVCGYQKINENIERVIAVADGTFDNTFFNTLPRVNQNWFIQHTAIPSSIKNRIAADGGYFVEDYATCGYPVNTKDNTACYFAAPK